MKKKERDIKIIEEEIEIINNEFKLKTLLPNVYYEKLIPLLKELSNHSQINFVRKIKVNTLLKILTGLYKKLK